MLSSKRFTTIVTADTRGRLQRAYDNNPPIAKGDRHRGAIVAIQVALADLNSSYMLRSEIDGFFGVRTARAVEAFQRDYGLVADGIVGRQLLSQIDALFSPDVARHPIGLSVHVGVDVLSDHYGNVPPLASCVNDALQMREIAGDLGYDSVLYTNEEATTTNFLSFIRMAAERLVSGDSLMVTVSCHGSQIANTSDDPEADMLDETLCFHDRMLVDDEFYSLLGELRDGIRVHVVLDSCHSGTAVKPFIVNGDNAVPKQIESYVADTKEALANELTFTGVDSGVSPPVAVGAPVTAVAPVAAVDGAPAVEAPIDEAPVDAGGAAADTPEAEGPVAEAPAAAPVNGGQQEPLTEEDLKAISADSLQAALDGEKPTLVDPSPPTPKTAAQNAKLAEALGEIFEATEFGKDKFLGEMQLDEGRRALYDAVKSGVVPREDVQPGCVITLLAACDDAQTTPAGNPLSYFTFNLTQVWNRGGFSGSYNDFHNAIRNRSRSDVTPQIGAYGPNGSEARLRERPFFF